MKRYIFFAVISAALCCICGCSKDDGGSSNNPNNANHNANIHMEDVVYSENITSSEALKVAQRIEIPSLKGSGNSFLVYKSSELGVNLCIEWDNQKKAQRWTAYQMTAASNNKSWNRNNWKNQVNKNEWAALCWEQSGHSYADPFQPDPTLPTQYRTELSDYRGSGFQRGHICASADRLSSMTANEQTFYLSNMHPMNGNFNGGIWEKMEEQVRKWSPTTGSKDTLFVCKGGTIDEVGNTKMYTNSSTLLVPKYFFMAILQKNSKSGNGGYKGMAFYVEHKASSDSNDISDYAMSIDNLEALTGIDFFCNLPDEIESQVESSFVPSVWGLK